MSKLLELLNLILSFGPKIPFVMEQIDIIVAAFQAIVDQFKTQKFAAAKTKPLSAKESAALAKVMAAMGGKQKFGGPFTNIFAWLKAHPEYIKIIFDLLKLL